MVYKVDINDDPVLKLTCFMERSNVIIFYALRRL